jgi:uncharacterized membrane protein YfcA
MDHTLILIAAVLVFAGLVKGVIGMGLPTVAIGLLATRMPPAQALAIVITPAILTNIWQTFAGGHFIEILRRLWPLMLGTVIGIRAGSGLMTGPYAAYGTIILGLLLIVYAILGLSMVRFYVPPAHEKWIGGVVGLITGTVSASTGVQIIPSMPFMQAIGLEKNVFVQALGMFFTTATIALAFNLTSAGLLSAATALPGGVALVAAFAGMFAGQILRDRMDAETFRYWFLISMMLLGFYLAGDMLWQLHGSAVS